MYIVTKLKEVDMQINQIVKTPIGQGTVQGILDRAMQSGEIVMQVALVRLPINQETSVHLQDSNCWTPHAQQSGLWLFSQSEIK
jgi:hypothetical protein